MHRPNSLFMSPLLGLFAAAVAACGSDATPIWWVTTPGTDTGPDSADADGSADASDVADTDVADTDVSDHDTQDRDAPEDGIADGTDAVPDVAPDTRPGDTAGNWCPVAHATCVVDGSGAPPATDLFPRPLDTLRCDGTGSYDSDGTVARYIWTIVERPDGSTSAVVPDDLDRTSFFVDLAGRFVLSLEVVDDAGCMSEPSLVTLDVRPDSDLHIQLVWETPTDTDATDIGFGAGADLDLHLLHENGCWEDLDWDCHFRARQPNWGGTGASNDDPSLDIDDTDGWGPENINLSHAESGVTYKVGVEYYNDHGFGASYATVRIYLFGELTFEARDVYLGATGTWWEVAAIHWPTAEVTPIDLVHDDVPACR